MREPRESHGRFVDGIDFTALDAPRAPGEAAVWRVSRPTPAWVDVVLGIVGMTAGSVALFSVIGFFAVPGPRAPLIFGVAFVVAAASLTGVILFSRRWTRRWGRRATLVGSRLPAFAEANGFEFRASSELDTSLPPAAGQQFNNPRVGPVMRSRVGADGPRFEIGYRVFHRPVPPDFVPTERAPYPVALDYGWYAAVQLPRRLPHIALLRRAEISGSNLDQRAAYSMGVEFDATFTLLVPPGYERDALYLFTPDVVAEMLDDAGYAAWGAEVLDDWLFFRFPLGTFPRAVFGEDLRRAFTLIDCTTAELAKQASGYRDERIGDRSLDLIADPGRRVRTRARPSMVIAGFGLPLMILAPFALIMAAAFAR